jgi:hypothetical protein
MRPAAYYVMGFVEVEPLGFLQKKTRAKEHGSINQLTASLRSFTNLEHLGA